MQRDTDQHTLYRQRTQTHNRPIPCKNQYPQQPRTSTRVQPGAHKAAATATLRATTRGTHIRSNDTTTRKTQLGPHQPGTSTTHTGKTPARELRNTRQDTRDYSRKSRNHSQTAPQQSNRKAAERSSTCQQDNKHPQRSHRGTSREAQRMPQRR